MLLSSRCHSSKWIWPHERYLSAYSSRSIYRYISGGGDRHLPLLRVIDFRRSQIHANTRKDIIHGGSNTWRKGIRHGAFYSTKPASKADGWSQIVETEDVSWNNNLHPICLSPCHRNEINPAWLSVCSVKHKNLFPTSLRLQSSTSIKLHWCWLKLEMNSRNSSFGDLRLPRGKYTRMHIHIIMFPRLVLTRCR